MTKKHINIQIFEIFFNDFATINMFFEIHQKFRTSKFTNLCLKQRFANIIENFKSNSIRSIRKNEKELNIIENRLRQLLSSLIKEFNKFNTNFKK